MHIDEKVAKWAASVNMAFPRLCRTGYIFLQQAEEGYVIDFTRLKPRKYFNTPDLTTEAINSFYSVLHRENKAISLELLSQITLRQGSKHIIDAETFIKLGESLDLLGYNIYSFIENSKRATLSRAG